MPSWLVLVVLVWAIIRPSCAGAATTIEICGSSTYTCPSTKFAEDTRLGDVVGGAKIQDSTGAKTIVVPVGVNYNGDAPSGWTRSSPTATPQPPSNVSGTIGGGVCTPPVNPEVNYVYTSGGGCNPSGGQCSFASYRVSDGAYLGQYENPPSACTLQCPTGYTSNGSSCDVSSPSSVMKPSDNKCGIIRSGNIYTADPQDPDCAGAGSAGAAFSLSVSGGVVTAGNAERTLKVEVNQTSGNARVDASTVGSFSTTTYSVSTGVQTGDGATATGTVTATASGTGSLAGEGSSSGNCGAPGQPPCKIDETGTGSDSGSLGLASSQLEADKAAQLSALNALAGANKVTNLGLSFGISWPSVGCTNPSFGVGSHVGTVPLCEKRADVNAVMSWFMFVVTAFYLFNLIREIV